jgi:hypothetical protein
VEVGGQHHALATFPLEIRSSSINIKQVGPLNRCRNAGKNLKALMRFEAWCSAHNQSLCWLGYLTARQMNQLTGYLLFAVHIIPTKYIQISD